MCVAVAAGQLTRHRARARPLAAPRREGGYRTQDRSAADGEAGQLERAVYGRNKPIDRLTAKSGEAEARGSRSSSSRSRPSGGRSAMAPSGCAVPDTIEGEHGTITKPAGW